MQIRFTLNYASTKGNTFVFIYHFTVLFPGWRPLLAFWLSRVHVRLANALRTANLGQFPRVCRPNIIASLQITQLQPLETISS